MSGRVAKTSRARPNQREGLDDLSSYIGKFGFEVMPCSSCFRRKEQCVMSEGSARCQNCILHKRQCDGSGIPIDSFQNIVREQDRLKREEALTEERLLRSQREMNEAIARLQRLRKLQEFLRHRGKEMVRRGLQSLEELERLEEEERRAENARPAGSAEASVDPEVVSDFDWSGMDVSGDLDWDAILAGASVGVGENSSEGVRYLSGD